MFSDIIYIYILYINVYPIRSANINLSSLNLYVYDIDTVCCLWRNEHSNKHCSFPARSLLNITYSDIQILKSHVPSFLISETKINSGKPKVCGLWIFGGKLNRMYCTRAVSGAVQNETSNLRSVQFY